MVTACGLIASMPATLLAAEKAVEPVLEQLDPLRRAAVVMALLALTLIGLFAIVFVMVGGHWVRKLARHRPGKVWKTGVQQAAEDRQLRKSLETFLPEAKTDDTIHLGTAPKDTEVGR
jgi:hypothetical protein